MSFFRRKNVEPEENPKNLSLVDFDMVDINEDLMARSDIFDDVAGSERDKLFGKLSEDETWALLEEAGLISALMQRKYKKIKLELKYLSNLDQRIFLTSKGRLLVHIRLKMSEFRFKLHKGMGAKRLIFIDWLLTQDFKRKNFDKSRLFPGQELPGLGIFSQISEFFRLLAPEVRAIGAFNMPEYFHDALLFHRRFKFYDPAKEAFFRALIRDLRSHGARAISKALLEQRIRSADDAPVSWHPGEMLSLLTDEFADKIWSSSYRRQVEKEMNRLRFTL